MGGGWSTATAGRGGKEYGGCTAGGCVGVVVGVLLRWWVCCCGGGVCVVVVCVCVCVCMLGGGGCFADVDHCVSVSIYTYELAKMAQWLACRAPRRKVQNYRFFLGLRGAPL